MDTDDALVETIAFRVIGELKSDPRRLLLEGDDGRWYDYDLALGTVAPADPSAAWAVDGAVRPDHSVAATVPHVA